VQSAPGFPCALSPKRDNEIAKLGQIMPRECFRLFEDKISSSTAVPGRGYRRWIIRARARRVIAANTSRTVTIRAVAFIGAAA
jgi:hypothetical protein